MGPTPSPSSAAAAATATSSSRAEQLRGRHRSSAASPVGRNVAVRPSVPNPSVWNGLGSVGADAVRIGNSYPKVDKTVRRWGLAVAWLSTGPWRRGRSTRSGCIFSISCIHQVHRQLLR